MDGTKQVGSSPTFSFTSDIFGSKESCPSSSSGIFGSIFSPSPKVVGRESLRSEVSSKTATEEWSSKIATQDDTSKVNDDDETQSTLNKDMSSIYQEQRVQPCHLSSSIYYGGQEIYSHPQNTQNAGLNSLYEKDSGEDDSGSASRGNWWQGSLYY
ncbi:hypothetical protein L6164_003433 [Bauhinia variegata]|uniref:Uncharacterized protein n=1 Tax=Bauhinia variegata TaxID=167791 RepID=A0ACB9Q1D0_BAUVA|nr:hypothetical protein L6164_003433 [Bauhinia variegata]